MQTAQVEANKRIATLAFENAKLEAAKEGRQTTAQAEKACAKPISRWRCKHPSKR